MIPLTESNLSFHGVKTTPKLHFNTLAVTAPHILKITLLKLRIILCRPGVKKMPPLKESELTTLVQYR